MAAPTYPNVPKTAGVPPVLRDPANPSTTPEPLLTQDSEAVDRLAATQWGIFDKGGAQVLQPDNIVAVEFAAEYRIADYPIEQGGFETFNKVATPFDNRVVMSKGGRLADRQAFHAKLESMRGDTNLYNVVTPEFTYRNVNIARVNLDRTATNGAGMLTFEVSLREIRQTATAAFTNSKTAAGADTASIGSVQTTATDQTGADIR